MGIYKIKQESKKTRKQELDQESDQKNKKKKEIKKKLDQESDQEKKKKLPFFLYHFLSRVDIFYVYDFIIIIPKADQEYVNVEYMLRGALGAKRGATR